MKRNPVWVKIIGTIVGSFVVVIMAGVLTACSQKMQEPLKDAPTGVRNSAPADVMSFPDGFSNVAAKCDGPNRVYVAFKGDNNRAAIAVVPDDPRCAGGGR